MISKCTLFKIILAIVIGLGIYTIIKPININTNTKEEKLFPGILGDMILKGNETGKYAIVSMTSYDNFKGYIVQGYKANYSGRNGTMIIFIAQMPDNISAERSLDDMVIRAGYNSSEFNESVIGNYTNFSIKLPIKNVSRLPVKNPKIFMMQKNNNTIWHYTFSKLDKVYWVGFNNRDLQYQIDMLIDVYKNVDKIKGVFDI